MISQEQFVRNFSTMANGEVDFFLGAGASITSGIPTGGDLIWEFKRTLFCSERGISKELYRDLALPSTRNMLQEYFDKKGNYPKQNAPDEYSFYFEQCYSDPLARKRFIEKIVTNIEPSIGYLCLAEIVAQNKIKNIWTTNFDPLLENAIHGLYPTNNILVCSESNRSSVNLLNPQYPVIGKLHGDYRYDWLRNTEYELQQLEEKLKEYAASQLTDKQLVVIGYSGNDESIMSFLEQIVAKPNLLTKGILWTVRKGSIVNSRVASLINKANNNGKPSGIIEIDGFDQLMFSIYQIMNYHNETIDKREYLLHEKSCINLTGKPVDSFIKLNAYKAENLPLCNVFETDIKSWSELREIIGEEDVLAVLYNKHIYSFSSVNNLKTVFKQHILSSVTMEEVPENIIKKHNSVYLDLIYKLIMRRFISNGMKSFARKKIFNPSSCKTDKGYRIFDAVEISITFISGSLFLNLLPTVHVMGNSGDRLDRVTYQREINRILSSLYNKQYNEKLKYWQDICRSYGRLIFENDGFSISFIAPAMSVGGAKRNKSWQTFPACMYEEPLMCFSDSDKSKRTVNQLKGLCVFGPIDCSYINSGGNHPSIRLAVLSPKQNMNNILAHLNKLNTTVSNNGKDKYIKHYEGFEKIFHRAILIPTEQQKDICIGYDGYKVANFTPLDFLSFMKRGINYFSEKTLDFDILVIYIPKYFERFRSSTTISSDFNLHDALKLYATEKGVRLQLIEEKSINYYDPCKVMWGLSTSLYAKANGVLWHPEAIQNDTAYIGISYAYSKEKGICIGCSQLFDSTGTGIRMVLRKVNNPIFLGKSNPYMRENDARAMMTELRVQYYHSAPVNTLKRIVIHKTTPFIREEISGIMQAFKGVNVELVQIQDYCSWRGIRFGNTPDKTAYGFAVKRGLAMQLDQDSFLLWTHGCVAHPEIAGSQNYYKGARGIPAPLLVRRYLGTTSADTLAKEILMLTKMNWNSGDCLYKTLPVTLDFAKVLARMSKQSEAIFDKAYDFRFFM